MPKVRKKSLARALGAGTASVAAAAAAVLVTTAPAYAATAAPATGPIGATVKIADASLNNVATPVVQIRADACSAFYATPSAGVVNAERVTKVSDGLTFGVPTLTLGANGVARLYNVCVYPGSTATSGVITAANATFTVYAASTSAPVSGASGGGNTVTVTAPSAVFGGTVSALFTGAACPAVYNAGGAIPATAAKSGTLNTAVTITVPSAVLATGGAPTPYNVCLYGGTTANDPVLTAATYAVSLPPITLSSTSGPFDATNGITLSSGPVNLYGGVAAPGVLFTPSAGCPTTWNTAGTVVAIPPAGVRKLGGNRLAVTVPRLPLTDTRQPVTYQLCTYTGTAPESTILAAAAYTSTILANPTAIAPSAGPTTGGTTITVMGTDFPTAPGSITATLGGVELIAVTPVNSTSFTATLPAHSPAEDATLVVTTSAGTKALPGAFSFLDAVKVSPNAATSTNAGIDVAVQGAGFLSYPFGSGGDASRVFLVRGDYNGAEAAAGIRANGPVAECGNVLVISDGELVCTLRLDRRLNATGDAFVNPATINRTLTADITTVAGSRVVTSALKSFGPDDIGHLIAQNSNTDIPAGSIIKSVLSPSKAVISAPAVNTNATPFNVTVGGAVHTVSAGLITATGNSTVRLVNGSFVKADIGRVVNGSTVIPDGTTITGIAPNGTSATLSAPASGSTSASLTIGTTQSSTTITGTFTANDVGTVIGQNPLGIPSGTRIVSQAGATAELSAPAGTTSMAATQVTVDRPANLTLFPAAPVQDGAYNLTIVSNGAPNAADTDTDYQQTAVTSGSTFTVGSF